MNNNKSKMNNIYPDKEPDKNRNKKRKFNYKNNSRRKNKPESGEPCANKGNYLYSIPPDAGKITVKKVFCHLKTILIHRKYVTRACFKMGLFFQGVIHDLSKFSPAEFLTGARYYDGHKSPNAVERILKGYSTAWLHHKGRNKHHLEYWIDFDKNTSSHVIAYRMPVKYAAEMIADRYAACKAYYGKECTDASAWEYYNRTKEFQTVHKDTRALLEAALLLMKDKGEDAAFKFVKQIIKEAGDAYSKADVEFFLNRYNS